MALCNRMHSWPVGRASAKLVCNQMFAGFLDNAGYCSLTLRVTACPSEVLHHGQELQVLWMLASVVQLSSYCDTCTYWSTSG